MSTLSIRRGLLTAAAVLAALPPAPASGNSKEIRKPRGIYAVVVLQEKRGAAKAVDLNALVNNPAVSGLAIRTFWSGLQPAKDRYDFSPLDAAFASAEAAHKTVQLILVPGFGTPQWVLDEIPSCDDLLTPLTDTGSGKGAKGEHVKAAKGEHEKGAKGEHGKAAKGEHEKGVKGGHGKAARGDNGQATTTGQNVAPDCGKASFIVSEGGSQGQQQELPLPWNAVYKKYWRAFLTEVDARFGSRDAFVSIAVAGPTAESVEIILPRSGDQLERWAELLHLFYRDASYQRSDKAFVEEWNAAVRVYGDVFHDVTIVLTRGSGLLDFTPHQSSAAQAGIVSSFASHDLGANIKATQTSGLKACRENEGGIKGVRELSSSSVLGGAQFDTSFSQKPANEGCRASCNAEAPACRTVTPEEALSNVLSVYFDGTPDGPQYGASKGSARLNYLQIYEKDILFANAQPAVQNTLEQASRRLLAQAR